MTEQKILLPYSFTSYDEKALNFIIETFANQKDIKITLFNTYTPLPTIDMDANPEMYKVRSAMTYLSKEIREKEAGLKSAKDFLLENGFSEDQVEYVFKKKKKSIADEIIESASQGNYSVVVLSRQPGKVTRLFARSIHEKLLSTLKDITVCIAN